MAEEVQVQETRSRPRYTFNCLVEATWSGYPVKLCNISGNGAQIEHADPLRVQSTANLKIPLPRSAETILLKGMIVWAKLSRTPDAEGKYLYRSGIRLANLGPAVAATVERVITVYSGAEDRDSLDHKRRLASEKARKDALRQQAASLESTWRRLPSAQRTVDPDKVLLIEQTLARLREESGEIGRLANRARKALQGKSDGFGQPDEVLAVWEYLERLMPVAMISEVLSKK